MLKDIMHPEEQPKQKSHFLLGAMNGAPTKLVLRGGVRNREGVPHKAERERSRNV
jgi:hypothetical protein